jgi:TPR repeat protein
MYLVGEGVPKNTDKAIEFFKKAEKQGNEEARENLKAIRAAGN